MPQTVTHRNAKDCAVHLDDVAGTLTDISGSTNNVGLNFTNNLGEAFTFAGDWPVRNDGKKDLTISLRLVFSPTANEGADLIRDWFNNQGARTLRVDAPDVAVNSFRFSGEVLLSSANFPLASDDGSPIIVEAECVPTGNYFLTNVST